MCPCKYGETSNFYDRIDKYIKIMNHNRHHHGGGRQSSKPYSKLRNNRNDDDDDQSYLSFGGRHSSNSYSKSRKNRYNDDDQSYLSSATPIISNTTKTAIMKEATRLGDESSDVTPIISNTNREPSHLKDYDDQDDHDDVEDDNALSSNNPIHFQSRVMEEYYYNSNIDHGDNGMYSQMQVSDNDSDLRSNHLFKIESGRIPPQLASRNSSASGAFDFRSSKGSILNDDDQKQVFKVNLNRTGDTNSSNKERRPSKNINEQMRSMMKELNIGGGDSLRWSDGFYKFSLKAEKNIPFVLCILFMIQLLLSCHSSLSCRFLTCNIGFKPLNLNFVQDEVDVGFWSFYSESLTGSIQCLGYPEDFTSMFIGSDSSWGASRYIGVVNIFLGAFIFLAVTIIVGFKIDYILTQTPSNVPFLKILEKRWIDVSLFTAVLFLIFESVKFVFMNIKICSQNLWMDGNGEMVSGKGCSLSYGGISSILTIALDIICIVLLTCVGRNHWQWVSGHDCDLMPLHLRNSYQSFVLNDEETQTPRIKDKNSDSSGSQRYIDNDDDLPDRGSNTIMDNSHVSSNSNQGEIYYEDSLNRNTFGLATIESGHSFDDDDSLEGNDSAVATIHHNQGHGIVENSLEGKNPSVVTNQGQRSNDSSFTDSYSNPFSRPQSRSMMRTSIGFYSNVDESLSMKY